MMKNDTNMTCKFWNFEIENQFLNFCVGESVGGKSPEVSRHALKVDPTIVSVVIYMTVWSVQWSLTSGKPRSTTV